MCVYHSQKTAAKSGSSTASPEEVERLKKAVADQVGEDEK